MCGCQPSAASDGACSCGLPNKVGPAEHIRASRSRRARRPGVFSRKARTPGSIETPPVVLIPHSRRSRTPAHDACTHRLRLSEILDVNFWRDGSRSAARYLYFGFALQRYSAKSRLQYCTPRRDGQRWLETTISRLDDTHTATFCQQLI